MTIKTKIKKKPVYGIQSYKEEEFYITSDNREFKSLKEAEQWQKQIDIANNIKKIADSIKKIKVNDYNFFDNETWFFIENDEQLDYLKNMSGFNDTYDDHFYYGDWKIGEWVTWEYHDGGDYRGQSNFYSLSYVKEHMVKFLNKFNDEDK